MNEMPKIYKDFESELQKIIIKLEMSRREYLKFITVSMISTLGHLGYTDEDVKNYLNKCLLIFLANQKSKQKKHEEL